MSPPTDPSRPNVIEFEETPDGSGSGTIVSADARVLKVASTAPTFLKFLPGQAWDTTGKYRLRSPYQPANQEVDSKTATA